MVLVDSSVWIALLRDLDTAPTRILRALLSTARAALSPMIYQEILQGAASERHFDTLRRYFGTQPLLAPRHPVRTHESAAEIFARCRWRGITPRSTCDCLIAQTAIEHDVPLLTDDRDFLAIASVEPRLRLHPVEEIA